MRFVRLIVVGGGGGAGVLIAVLLFLVVLVRLDSIGVDGIIVLVVGVGVVTVKPVERLRASCYYNGSRHQG